MFCPIVPTPEEQQRMDEGARKFDEEFKVNHPFLSTFVGLVSVLAQLAFWITGLFIVIFFLF
ncbi:hypothetical protein [Turicimonas sp. TL08]